MKKVLWLLAIAMTTAPVRQAAQAREWVISPAQHSQWHSFRRSHQKGFGQVHQQSGSSINTPWPKSILRFCLASIQSLRQGFWPWPKRPI